MGKTTQTLIDQTKPMINELSINGTKEQIQRIWNNNKWDLTLQYNDEELEFKTKKEVQQIKLKLKTEIPCCEEDWSTTSLLLNFRAKSRTASMVLMPLLKNGMQVRVGPFVLSKKNITIS